MDDARALPAITGRSRPTMKRLGAVLRLLCVGAVLAAGASALVPGPAAAFTFTPEVTQLGPPETVFDWSTMACEPLDIPDSSATAFRDASGRVQLISSHFTSRRMIGPSLSDMRHDCRVLATSAFDPDPANFQDYDWIGSVYSEDGSTVYALMSSEYHGWAHNQCPSPLTFKQCWLNSITLAVSEDGGDSYTHAPPPANLIATSAYPYSPGAGPLGYFDPGNVIRKSDGYYYALIRVESHETQPEGACLLRTQDLSDPASWRAWDGTGFSIQPDDPYLEPTEDPADHVCQPVSYEGIVKMSASLTYNTYFGKYLLVDYSDRKDPITGQMTESGVYYSLSDDLVHWTPQRKFMDVPFPWTYTCGGEDPVLNTIVLDPDSPTRNFETSDQTVYLYFTRFHYTVNNGNCFQSLDRDLVRIPIEFTSTGAAAATAAFTAPESPVPAGSEAVFDASASRTIDDSKPSYRWDLDGNGTFETASGNDPVVTGSYGRPGRITVRLRVSDELGDTMESERKLTVIGCDRHGRRGCRKTRNR
jgi:hypothetical protein